jgi:hypothetical protein
MALKLTQPLTQMITRNISWWEGGGKGGWCVRLTTLPSSRTDFLEILNPESSGTLRTCWGLFKSRSSALCSFLPRVCHVPSPTTNQSSRYHFCQTHPEYVLEVSHPSCVYSIQNHKMYQSIRTQLFQQKWYMQYLQYQLHVSASTLAIIRLAFNLSRDYAICMVYPLL